MYHKTELENGCAKMALFRPYSVDWVAENLGGDPKKLFIGETDSAKNYNSELHIITSDFFQYPVVDGEELREMTEYEKYEAGLSYLSDGQYAENGEIITVNSPSSYHTWDSELNKWILTDEKRIGWETIVLSELAAYRYSVQSGTLFESGDFTSNGSTNSYLYVDQTYNKIAEGTISDTRWKNADGRTWATLNADSLSEFKTMRDNLSSFVDKCFKTEEQVQIELLADLTISYKERFNTILASL
jgi:hypothetical protein